MFRYLNDTIKQVSRVNETVKCLDILMTHNKVSVTCDWNRETFRYLNYT